MMGHRSMFPWNWAEGYTMPGITVFLHRETLLLSRVQPPSLGNWMSYGFVN